MKAPRKFFEPLAIGAPRPLLELPSRLERMRRPVSAFSKLGAAARCSEHAVS